MSMLQGGVNNSQAVPGASPTANQAHSPPMLPPVAVQTASAKPDLNLPMQDWGSVAQSTSGPTSGHTAPSSPSWMMGADPSQPSWQIAMQHKSFQRGLDDLNRGPRANAAAAAAYADRMTPYSGTSPMGDLNAQIDASDSQFNVFGGVGNVGGESQRAFGNWMGHGDPRVQRQRAGQFVWGASAATNIGHAYMAQSPSADIREVGAVGGLASSMGVMGAFGSASPYVAAAGAVISGASSITGGAQDYTYSKLVEQAQLERVRHGAAMSGADLGASSRLAKEGVALGYRPSEAAWQTGDYLNGIGSAASGGLESPLRYALGGVGVGAQKFYMQGGAVGGGARGSLGDVESAMHGTIGVGYAGGMRGDNLTRLVSRMGAIMEGMASQGLKVDPNGWNQFMANSQASGIDTMQAMRTGQAFSGEAGDLKSQLAAPYQGMAQAAMMSYIGKRAHGDFEAMQMSEELQSDPMKANAAFMEAGFSRDARLRSLTSMLKSTKLAEQYADGLKTGTVTKAGDMQDADFMGPMLPGTHLAFPSSGATPGSEALAATDQKVAEDVQKDFIKTLSEFTAVMKRQNERNTSAGQATAGFDFSFMGILAAGGGIVDMSEYSYLEPSKPGG